MAAGKHGSSEVIISFGANTMTSFATQLNGVDVEGMFEDTTAFGAAFATSAYAGVKKMNPPQLTGFYDDTASTGPDAVFGSAQIGTYATLTVTWGNSKSTSVSAAVQKYSRAPGVGKLTRYTVTLMPSGTITEV